MAIALASAPATPICRLPPTALSCAPIVGMWPSAAPTIGSAISGRRRQNHAVLGHRNAGDQAEYDKHQRHVHHAERDKPGDDCEHNIESAGKPADLLQHITPSLVIPLSDLAPLCVGTETD